LGLQAARIGLDPVAAHRGLGAGRRPAGAEGGGVARERVLGHARASGGEHRRLHAARGGHADLKRLAIRAEGRQQPAGAEQPERRRRVADLLPEPEHRRGGDGGADRAGHGSGVAPGLV